MIQIRNVPEDVHRTLKSRAVRAGMPLSDYLLAEIERLAKRPTLEELVERIRRRTRIRARESSAVTVRGWRDMSSSSRQQQ